MSAVPPKSLAELQALIRASGTPIERDFKSLHHFSKHPPFSTPASSFTEFADYCEGLTQGIRPGGQNEQTIQRTYCFVGLLQKGKSALQAREQAWSQFPLVGYS